MDTPPPQKKGLGVLGWLGIGCGGIIVLGLIGIAVVVFMNRGSIAEAQNNPTRFAATVAVKVSGGQLQIVAEDNEKKRYTLKDSKSGTMTTIYWSAKQNKPVTIQGDFSAIPADEDAAPAPPAAPAAEK